MTEASEPAANQDAPSQDHGHHWKEAGRVADFAERMDARAEERDGGQRRRQEDPPPADG